MQDTVLHVEVEWSATCVFKASLQRLKIVWKESQLGSLFRIFMDLPLFRSVLRPISRVLVGLIAIPIFRFIMRKVFRLQDLVSQF